MLDLVLQRAFISGTGTRCIVEYDICSENVCRIAFRMETEFCQSIEELDGKEISVNAERIVSEQCLQRLYRTTEGAQV
jgi:hypothetical protein